jgi:Flp pilus assembly protein CpaB
MTYRLRNITIAIALALVAALLTSFYVSNYQRNVRADETNVVVYTASRDIPAGTQGASAVKQGMLKKTEIVRRSVVPGSISNPDQLEGLVATEQIYAGEQITSRRFSAPSERGIHAQLKGPQRAIAVAGDKQQLLAGTLRDGDRVDLVATFAAPESMQLHFSRIVLRDVEVLRAPAGGSAAPESITNDDGYDVMLKVTDTQVQKLHWTTANAKEWHLELRPATDAADSPENLESWYSILREGANRKQLDEAGADGVPAIGEETAG